MNLFLQNVVESFMRKNAFSGLQGGPVKKNTLYVTPSSFNNCDNMFKIRSNKTQIARQYGCSDLAVVTFITEELLFISSTTIASPRCK